MLESDLVGVEHYYKLTITNSSKRFFFTLLALLESARLLLISELDAVYTVNTYENKGKYI